MGNAFVKSINFGDIKLSISFCESSWCLKHKSKNRPRGTANVKSQDINKSASICHGFAIFTTEYPFRSATYSSLLNKDVKISNDCKSWALITFKNMVHITFNLFETVITAVNTQKNKLFLAPVRLLLAHDDVHVTMLVYLVPQNHFQYVCCRKWRKAKVRIGF